MNNSFIYQRFNAFDWIVHKKTLQAGEVYTVVLTESMLPSESDNVTLWTKGKIEGLSETGIVPQPRVAGMFSLDYTQPLRAGKYTFTAIEDSEWWCVNWKVNNRDLPNLTAFRSSTSGILPIGIKLLICSGSIVINTVIYTAGDTIEITSMDMPYTVTEQVLGMLFDRAKK